MIGGAASATVADAAALDAAASGWFYDAAGRWQWVKLPASSSAVRVDIGG